MKKSIVTLSLIISMIVPSCAQAIDPIAKFVICNTLTSVGALFGPTFLHYRYEKSIETDTQAELHDYKEEAIAKVIKERKSAFNHQKSKPCPHCDHKELQPRNLSEVFKLRGLASNLNLMLAINTYYTAKQSGLSSRDLTTKFCSDFMIWSTLLAASTLFSLCRHAYDLQSYKTEAMANSLDEIKHPYLKKCVKINEILKDLQQSLTTIQLKQEDECNQVIRIKDNRDIKENMIQSINDQYGHRTRSIKDEIRSCQTDCTNAEAECAIFDLK